MAYIGRTPTNAALTASDLADGIVSTAKIAADAVTGAQLADNAVNSEHYTDGSIDTAHIADNQITLAKLAGGTDGNIISFDASGDPVAIATGSDGQVLTSTGAGSPPAFEAIPAGGITIAHQWRLTTSFTGEAIPIASNWEQVDTDGYGGIGSVMSQSSGIFTFPETGIYYISFGINSTLNGNDRAVGGFIQTTTDNSSYSTASQGTTFINTPGSVAYANAFMDFMFDVTNVSTHKCRFGISNVNSSTETNGSTAQNATYATFIKLGDT